MSPSPSILQRASKYISSPYIIRPFTDTPKKFDAFLPPQKKINKPQLVPSPSHGHEVLGEVVALHEAALLRVLGGRVVVDEGAEELVAAAEGVVAAAGLLHEEVRRVLGDLDGVQRVVDGLVRNFILLPPPDTQTDSHEPRSFIRDNNKY